MRAYPIRAYFKPGEAIQITVSLEQAISTPVSATVYHLSEPVAVWETTCNGTSAVLQGHVPADTRRGYLAHVQAGEESVFTAFDVLHHWTQAPRYGFLYDFSSSRSPEDINATLDYLLALHINGLQFYDWQYRHDTLLAPRDEYTDPLGRALSLTTIRRLIDEAHRRGMAAMPYTAIYAASPPFAAAHPDWQLFDKAGEQVDFAGGFLKLMNPDSEWQTHFVRECRRVLEALPFDGIHVDQYGEPKTGFNRKGEQVDLPSGFVDTLDALHQAIPAEKALLFNLVHNWPVEEIARSPLDFWYSELWPPETNLSRLWQTVCDNRRLNERPTVLAVYIPSQWEETVAAVHSTILAAGGTPIAHGDHRRYLSDPYFPKAETPSPALTERLQKLADFAVAYEEALVFAEDVTEAWRHHIRLNDEQPQPGQIIVHTTGNCLYVSLLRGDGKWDSELPSVQPQCNLQLALVAEGLRRMWWASPDEPIAHEQPDLPRLKDWLLICLEFEETPSCPT
jgi:dextranase